ncbi:hypothetical protein [Luteolibacter sp. LG18]|uniref:hypothetical protein n=1 Tax=Luteolibacter sp. LG18 TaxID=2819286 RepID=UPI002B2BA5EF|nr:hypothetical protein llg_41920 [Luteolibacter sp. LG18]
MRPFLLLLALALPLAAAPAEGPSPAETKLRETLKATMLQLRTAEADKANLQAEKDVNDAKVKELAAQVDKLTKQAAADQTTAKKQIEDLTGKNAAQEQLIGKFKEALEKWKEGYAKASGVANAKEAERSKLSDQNAILRRKVEDQRAKNVALAKTANEILDRYSKFGVGEALSAREPFTGITRARLEALVQDYSDKIEDNRLKPEPAPAKKDQSQKKP